MMISNLHSSVLVSASLILYLSLPARAGTNDETKPGSASTQQTQTGVGVPPKDQELDVLDIQAVGSDNKFDYYTRCTGITSKTPNEECSISTKDPSSSTAGKPLCNCAISQIMWLVRQLNKANVTELNISPTKFDVSVKNIQIFAPGNNQGIQERIVIKLPDAIFEPSMKERTKKIISNIIVTFDSGGSPRACYKSIPECLNKGTAFPPSSPESKQPQQSPPRI
jgi:hypothetical protein